VLFPQLWWSKGIMALSSEGIKDKVRCDKLINESIAFTLKFVRNCATAYENHPDVFTNDSKKSTRKMIERGLDYAHAYALKAIPQEVKNQVSVGNDAFLTNIVTKLGASDDKNP
jgi:hypothetical protein